MIEGYDIAFSIPAAPNDYGITHHAVLANKAVEQTVIRVNGKKSSRHCFISWTRTEVNTADSISSTFRHVHFYYHLNKRQLE